MTSNHTPPRCRRAIAVAIAVTAVLTVAGCGSWSTPDEDTSSSTGAPAQQWNPDDLPSTEWTPPNITTPSAQSTLPSEEIGVDRSDAKAVAAAATRIWFTWDTTTDQSSADASARAASLLTADLSRAVLANVSIRPSAQWRTWKARKALVTPRVTARGNQGAPDSSTRRYFLFQVVQTARDPKGRQVGSPVTRTVWVITTRTSSNWEVSQLQEQI